MTKLEIAKAVAGFVSSYYSYESVDVDALLDDAMVSADDVERVSCLDGDLVLHCGCFRVWCCVPQEYLTVRGFRND